MNHTRLKSVVTELCKLGYQDAANSLMERLGEEAVIADHTCMANFSAGWINGQFVSKLEEAPHPFCAGDEIRLLHGAPSLFLKVS